MAYRDGPSRGRQIPATLLITSPVRSYYGGSFGGGWEMALSLDLVQKIISYVDSPADLARMTRASRLFYYMALPRLYERVVLKAHSEMRYIDGQPEGYGGGTPFGMGLGGLVTRNFASYVKHLKLSGEWRERDLEEFSMGRIPDSSMMLNIAIRAALDRMTILDSFHWDMNAKPMDIIYQGLVARPTLRSLTIKSPTQRIIRPACVAPGIPSLQVLTIMDMDPLCYPDDFSVMLLQSKKLEELNLHWSPRMREEGEPSINLHSLVGKCIAAGYKMPLKRMGVMNLYVMNERDFEEVTDPTKLERLCYINNVDAENPKTVFFDNTWINRRLSSVPKNLKMIRGDTVNKMHTKVIATVDSLEEFYIVNRPPAPKPIQSTNGHSTPSREGIGSTTAPSNNSGTSTPHSSRPPQEHISLASDYIAVLTHHHGHSLRKLLLSDDWQLNESTLAHLLRGCPGLSELGVRLEHGGIDPLHRVMAADLGPNLRAVRLLFKVTEPFWQLFSTVDDAMHEMKLSIDLAQKGYRRLQWFGIGLKAFRCGPVDGTGKGRRKVKAVPLGVARVEVDVFGMDVMSLRAW